MDDVDVAKRAKVLEQVALALNAVGGRTLTIIESPYSGDVGGNLRYLEECMRDCIAHGEIPYASHRLYPGVLNDAVALERNIGIGAGYLFGTLASASSMGVTIAFYNDRGISPGMDAAREYWNIVAKHPGVKLHSEERFLYAPTTQMKA